MARAGPDGVDSQHVTCTIHCSSPSCRRLPGGEGSRWIANCSESCRGVRRLPRPGRCGQDATVRARRPGRDGRTRRQDAAVRTRRSGRGAQGALPTWVHLEPLSVCCDAAPSPESWAKVMTSLRAQGSTSWVWRRQRRHRPLHVANTPSKRNSHLAPAKDNCTMGVGRQTAYQPKTSERAARRVAIPTTRPAAFKTPEVPCPIARTTDVRRRPAPKQGAAAEPARRRCRCPRPPDCAVRRLSPRKRVGHHRPIRHLGYSVRAVARTAIAVVTGTARTSPIALERVRTTSSAIPSSPISSSRGRW